MESGLFAGPDAGSAIVRPDMREVMSVPACRGRVMLRAGVEPGECKLREAFRRPLAIVSLVSAMLLSGSCAGGRTAGEAARLGGPLPAISSEERAAMAARDNRAHPASFNPDMARMMREPTDGAPQRFAAREKAKEEKTALLIRPDAPPALDLGPGEPLADFRAKLEALAAKTRREPVVIVHIGDSHIAADSFSRGVRTRLQALYGDAGRGQVIPANAYKYAIAQAVSLDSGGPWRSVMSLKSDDGVFGLSGVRVESSSASAIMTLKAENRFDWAEVTVATGPGQGSFEVMVDGKPAGRFEARAATAGARTFRIDRAGRQLSVRPVGNGEVGVLHWATARETPGVRYVNFGQSGATVSVTRRWNTAALENDLAKLKPDLIVYGFGTNEGFDDGLDIAAYRKYVAGFLGAMKTQAPQAEFLIIGAPDGMRRKGGVSCGNGWSVPGKLGPLRAAMSDLAAGTGAGYWDWSAAMGGQCSMAKWVRDGLAAKDHVHFTPKGYDRAAGLFVEALTGVDSKQVAAIGR